MNEVAEVVEEDVVELETEETIVESDDNTEEIQDSQEETVEKNLDEDSDTVSEESDEVVVTIGDSPTQEEDKAPEWVKEVRKKYRNAQKENRELKERLEKLENPAPKSSDPGPKPTLESFDYDTDKFEAAYETWQAKNLKAQEEQRAVEEQKKAQVTAWNTRLSEYDQMKAELKVKDYEDAEEQVLSQFDQTQQGVVVQGAKNPALVVYALGKNPKKLQELSEIKDPVKFAVTVGRLEGELKVSNRKATPQPEKRVAPSSAPKSGVVDSTLDRLRAEAEKSGNYTKVYEYKKAKKAAENK